MIKCCVGSVCGRRQDFQKADRREKTSSIVIPAFAGILDDARFRGHPGPDTVFQKSDGGIEFPPVIFSIFGAACGSGGGESRSGGSLIACWLGNLHVHFLPQVSRHLLILILLSFEF